MEYTVKVDGDSVSELVRQSLADSLSMVLRDEADHETKVLSTCLILAHEYYSTEEQHTQMLVELQGDIDEFDERYNQAHIDPLIDLQDEEDGGLTINIDADEAMVQRFAEQGIEYLLLQEMFGRPSMDDLIRWIEAGKAIDVKE